MKVFISWSGQRSKAVASLLKEWIPSVMQHVEVWFSDDMERGSVWFNEICKGLSDVSVGVICLTQENLNNPWILFEAGAIAKGIPENRVCTLLVDLKPEDVSSPLSQFNATLPEQESLFKLIKTINDASTNALPPDRLERSFRAFWSDFEGKFKDVLANVDAPSPKSTSRSQKEVLADILESVRRIERNTFSPQDVYSLLVNSALTHSTAPTPAFDSSGTKYYLPDLTRRYRKPIPTKTIYDVIARPTPSTKSDSAPASEDPPPARHGAKETTPTPEGRDTPESKKKPKEDQD